MTRNQTRLIASDWCSLKVVILLFYNIDFGYPKRICLLNDLLLCCQRFLPAARVKTFFVKSIHFVEKYLSLRLFEFTFFGIAICQLQAVGKTTWRQAKNVWIFGRKLKIVKIKESHPLRLKKRNNIGVDIVFIVAFYKKHCSVWKFSPPSAEKN